MELKGVLVAAMLLAPTAVLAAPGIVSNRHEAPTSRSRD